MRKRKNIHPLIKEILKSYLTQENVSIEFRPNERDICDFNDDIVGIFVIKQDDQEVMRIHVCDEDLNVCSTIIRTISYVAR